MWPLSVVNSMYFPLFQLPPFHFPRPLSFPWRMTAPALLGAHANFFSFGLPGGFALPRPAGSDENSRNVANIPGLSEYYFSGLPGGIHPTYLPWWLIFLETILNFTISESRIADLQFLIYLSRGVMYDRTFPGKVASYKFVYIINLALGIGSLLGYNNPFFQIMAVFSSL